MWLCEHLRVLQYTIIFIKFHHLYLLGTCYVCFFGKGKRGTPHMHGHKESNKDLNLKILTSDLMNTRLTLYQRSIRRSDVSILGILRDTVICIKFNHLYLICTGYVCFSFWEGSWEHPIFTGTRRVIKRNWKKFTSDWDSNPRLHEN